MEKYIVHPAFYHDAARTPEENLLIAVIVRAIMDLKDTKEYHTARCFLLSEECELFCEYLGIDMEYFARTLASLKSQKAVRIFFKLHEYSYGRRANGFKERA